MEAGSQEKGPVLIEFVHSVIQSVKMYKIRIIFTALKSDIDSALMKDLNMFADKVIHTQETPEARAAKFFKPRKEKDI